MELDANLAAARAAADHALAAARGDAAVAAAALDAGLVATLQGDVGWAIERLDEALAVGVGATDAALAGALRELAVELRLGVLPGGATTSALELTARRGSRRSAAPASTDPADARLVHEVLVALPVNRNMLDLARWFDQDPEPLLDGWLGDLPLRGEPLPPGWSAVVELAAADLCRRGGQLERAREWLAVALERYRAAGDEAGEGACHLAEGDWVCAPLSTPSTLDLLPVESSGASSGLPVALELAELGLLGAPPPAAEAAYERAAACFSASGAARGIAAVDLRRGYLAILRGEPVDAREHAGRARAGFEAAGDRLGAQLAAAHHVLAAVWAGDLPEDASTAASIGAWGRDEGSFSFALGIGLMFNRAGRHAQLRGEDLERALACHRLAQALFTALGAELNTAQSLVDQGDVRRAIGDGPGASISYDEALAQVDAVALEDPEAAGTLAFRREQLLHEQWGLAILFKDPEALKRLQPRLRDQEKIAHGAVLEPLYRALRERDELHNSLVPAHRDKALAAARQAGDLGDYLEAVVRLSFDDRDGALDAYLRHLARVDAQAAAGDAGAVLPPALVKEAQQYALTEQVAFLVQLGEWREARRRFDALERLAGPDWWEREVSPWAALDYLGQMHEGAGEMAAALEFYKRAMATLERRRERLTAGELRVAQTGGHAAGHPFLHAARAALRAAEQATDDGERGELSAGGFAAAERGRARALLDVMSASAALAGGTPGELEPVRRWRELSAQLAAGRAALVTARADDASSTTIAELERMLGEQEAALATVETALARERPRWREIVAPSSPVLTLDEVAARMPADTVLLEYLFGEDDVLGWAIGRDGLLRVHREHRETWALRAAIAHFTARAGGGNEAWDEHASTLAETFLAPFGSELERYRHVIFVPWDRAHQLPLHALPWEGAPLIESHTVSVLPSAAALGLLDTGTSALEGPALAVGNPTRMAYRSLGEARATPYRDLPWTAAEAAFVAAQFPGGEALLGPAATEAALRERIPRFPVVHLASHAVLERNPLQSHLLLADGDALTLYELLGLDLDGARLVVLSACETARGAVTGGDDVLGLSWGMLAAGARAGIASLWEVDAWSAPLLMAALYRRLRAGDSPRIALQAAQLHVRGLDADAARDERAELRAAAQAAAQPPPKEPLSEPNYEHPRHWAPYVLIGS